MRTRKSASFKLILFQLPPSFLFVYYLIALTATQTSKRSFAIPLTILIGRQAGRNGKEWEPAKNKTQTENEPMLVG